MYRSGVRASNNDSSINVVHYKLTPNRLEQMAKHETVKRTDEETLKNEWRKDVQLPTNFEQHLPAISCMINEIKSMWDGHLGRINVAKHRIEPLND